ncbi:MAG: formate C-acetyltransferase/glycerol dehydratase family glycyl radical enzyme [Candidatus Lokiarchaeota archaeon]|nr:formate C-acetyltransferase/glycerol dehydratase family glycyl radical enzyme [Candidatus Lokiarchaeota archaeon]
MQVEQISPSDYKDRILRMKKEVISKRHELCIERAKLFTESYKTTKNEPQNIRFAKAMYHLLNNMTILIWDDEFIVGNRCSKFIGTPLYPEVRVDTIEQDLELYSNRDVQRFLLSEEDKKVLREEIIPYWKNEEETVKSRFDSYLNPELTALMLNLLYIVDTNMTNGVGHFFPGHKNVLKSGFNGLIQTAKAKKNDFSKDREKLNFLDAVIIVLEGVQRFIQRFSTLANEMAENEPINSRKNELLEISEICSKISSNPPESFKEALQLIYFTHIISGLEDGGFAISIGRLDQVLYPYYIKDKKVGIITDEEVRFLIECFYLKLSTLWNYVLHKGIVAGEGPPIAENLTIGGIDRDGNDATNELSYILLEAYNNLKTVQPAFSVRVHNNTPDDLVIQTGEAIKSGASIALFNDLVMIPGLIDLGYTLEDAREYAPIGCVEPVHPHKSFGCTNATQMNIVKVLELTLNNGIDMFTRKEYGLKNSKQISTYSDLWEEFSSQLSYFVKNMVETMNFLEKTIAELNPQPFLSATTDDCFEKGIDITNGGAKYDFTTTQLIGLATVADSLAVIKKVVFEDKLLSFEDMITMLSKNYRGTYSGKKGEEWRQFFINKIPKFGNDDDYVDYIARDVANLFCEEILKQNNYRGGKYNPGIYSTSFHLALGVFTAATADGRKSREYLSNGIGPTNGRDKNGPTAILNSIKKLDNELMTNGNSIIISFHPNTLKMELFVPLIRTYFVENGGFHIQFNVIGKETLCDAQLNPEEYQGLVVRIAGYSVLFTELSKQAQDDIIARTQY